MNEFFYQKYLKYKMKYLKHSGGTNNNENCKGLSIENPNNCSTKSNCKIARGPKRAFCRKKNNVKKKTTIKIDKSKLRLLNVKEPWATAIISGFKDVENRGYPLPLKNPSDSHVLILASGSKPTKNDLETLRKKLGESGVSNEIINHMITMKYPRKAIVGIAKFKGSTWNQSKSIWYNGNSDPSSKSGKNYAWEIDTVIKFNEPINDVEGHLSLRYYNKLSNNEQIRLNRELKKHGIKFL